MSRRPPGDPDPPAPSLSTGPETPAGWRARADELLRRGAPLPAYDVVSDGLQAFPGDPGLRQRLALALARSGASRQACALLETLRDEGHRDEETLGLLARTHKDLAAAAGDAALRRRHLEQARASYREAFAVSSGYWSAINVATMAVLLDAGDEARTMADWVLGACRPLATPPAGAESTGEAGAIDRYWVLATLGEAALVRGDLPQALDWYARAVDAGSDRLGDRVSTRRNARLILRHRGLDPAAFDACFGIPRVVVCVGHLIDRVDRPVPRFPPALEPAVRDQVRRRLEAHRAGVGFASAACGADLICLECLGERGAATHVVLPYEREPFRADSVAIRSDGDWPARFDRAIEAADDVIVASERPVGDPGAAFQYAFRLLDGAAGVRADELDTDLVCLAVWDGRAGDGPGGTAEAVAHWRRVGRTVDVIDLAALAGAAGVADSGHREPAPAARDRPDTAARSANTVAAFDTRVVTLLFADVAGFSRLAEPQLPAFVQHYLGLVARQLEGIDAPPLLANTWGDGLYLVFERVRDAGLFALRLCEAVRETDWHALGFHAPLDVRVGLHAGPAYACEDPVTRRPNFVGAHVSRAARIEPVTPPGAVYASRAFAALARSDAVREFTCAYVGPMPLAKRFGTFPTYVVRPTGA